MDTCPRCGEQLGPEDRACPRCGMDLVAMRRFFKVAGGPATITGYAIVAVVCAVLAVLMWLWGYPVAAIFLGVGAVVAGLVAIIGRGTSIGQRE